MRAVATSGLDGSPCRTASIKRDGKQKHHSGRQQRGAPPPPLLRSLAIPDVAVVDDDPASHPYILRTAAEVAEWYTRRSQKPMGASPCGFESHLPQARLTAT